MSSKASPSATTSENTTQQETTESQSKDTPKGDEDHGFDPLETNRTESYWIGKFNPYPGVNFSTDSNTIVESGKLCEKCTSMNECLGWALCLATKEERIAGWPLEFDHYETGILLEQSGQQGCHLCVLLWQAEIEADENWGPGEGAYSTRWAALREFRMLHVEALRPYTLRLRRSGGPHSLERKRNKATCKLAVGKGTFSNYSYRDLMDATDVVLVILVGNMFSINKIGILYYFEAGVVLHPYLLLMRNLNS
jgi:hypothetical protein